MKRNVVDEWGFCNKSFYMNPTQRSRRSLRLRSRLAALLGGSFAFAAPLSAQLSWDGGDTSDGVFNGGGTGAWNTTDANWGNPALTANVAWTADSAALFGGSAGTVTVGEAISASGLSFGTNGYILARGTNGSLTLTDGAVIDTASGATATILSGLISGNAALSTTGGGTLVLEGQSGRSGSFAINAGTVIAVSNASFGANNTPNAVSLNNATLDIRRDSGAFNIGLGLTVTGNSTLVSSRVSAGSGQTNGSVGGLSIGNATLNFVAGANVANNTNFGWRVGDTFGTDTVSLTGDATFNIGVNGTGVGTMTFASNAAINDGGQARTITKQGGGDLVVLSTATSLVDGTVINVQGGTVAARAAGAFGSMAAVNLASSDARFEFGTTNGAGVANTIKSVTGFGTVVSANGGSSTGTNTLTISSAITPGGNGVGLLTFDTVNPAGASTVTFAEGMTLAFDLGAAGASDQIRFLNYSAGELLLNGNVINFTNTIGEAAAGQTYTLFEFYSDGIAATAVASGIASGLEIGAGLEAFIGSTLNYGTDSISLTVGSAIPEPGAFALLAGVAGLGFAATRRRRRNA